MSPEFLFFDIGNVLLRFDNRLACRQVAELFGVPQQQVWNLWFGSDMGLRYEAGEVSTQEFYQHVCQQLGTTVDFVRFSRAVSDIFSVNSPTKALVSRLAAAGYPLGLLSNTNELHWNHFTDGRYCLMPELFQVHALSFRLRALKPQLEIYRAAAALAGVAPERIFFTDDLPENVQGAREAGFDAVPFTTAAALGDALRARGVRFNF